MHMTVDQRDENLLPLFEAGDQLIDLVEKLRAHGLKLGLTLGLHGLKQLIELGGNHLF